MWDRGWGDPEVAVEGAVFESLVEGVAGVGGWRGDDFDCCLVFLDAFQFGFEVGRRTEGLGVTTAMRRAADLPLREGSAVDEAAHEERDEDRHEEKTLARTRSRYSRFAMSQMLSIDIFSYGLDEDLFEGGLHDFETGDAGAALNCSGEEGLGIGADVVDAAKLDLCLAAVVLRGLDGWMGEEGVVALEGDPGCGCGDSGS